MQAETETKREILVMVHRSMEKFVQLKLVYLDITGLSFFYFILIQVYSGLNVAFITV